MATQCFFRIDPASTQRGTNTAKLNGSAIGWRAVLLSTTRGAASIQSAVSTVTGPTNGLEVLHSGRTLEWISGPVDADVTIAGTITMNLWSHETAMNDNAAINCILERLNSQGGIASTILQTARVTELGTATAAVNFTGTPTSTNMLKGDRFRARVFADDAGTMASPGPVYFTFAGPTAAADGDSYVTFTENFGFETTAPAGSQLFLTDTVSDVATAAVDREMWTARGAGVANDAVNTAAGWTTPIQWTDTAGGTISEWYSKQLTAFTLGDLVRCNLRALESSLAANASLRAEVSVCNSDGSGAVVWAAGNNNDANFGEITDTEAAYVVDICGDDVAVTNGQRLRFRVYIDDMSDIPLVTGHTCTFYYAGTSGGASGDSYLTLTQSVTEFSAVVASLLLPPFRQTSTLYRL